MTSQLEPPKSKPLVGKLIESKSISRLSFTDYRETVRRHYDGLAGALLETGSLLAFHRQFVPRLFGPKSLDLSRCERILDAGSGSGQFLRHIVRRAAPNAHISCFDLSLAMLQRSRKRLKSDRPRPVVADLTRLPYRDGVFDCVVLGWVIEHLPDPRAGLAEVCRVLRPGGKALIVATESTFPGAWVSRIWKCRTYERDELRAACQAVGLRWNRVFWWTPVHALFKLGGIQVEVAKGGNGSGGETLERVR